MKSLRVVALLGAVLLGCADSEPGARFVVRDSAGVAIAESSAPRWQPGEGWRVDSIPLLSLGGPGEGVAKEFNQVVSAVRLPGGAIVVADAGSRQIRQFSPDGEHAWTGGRQGDGPGDYNSLRSVSRFRADSLLAYDYWIGRATVLAADGQTGRTFVVAPEGARADRVYLLNDSSMVAEFWGRPLVAPVPGLIRTPRTIVRVSVAGAIIDTIAVVAGDESVLQPNGDDARALFGRRSHAAVFANRILLGTADLVAYTIHEENGKVFREVRAPGIDLSLSPEVVARERAEILSGVPPRAPPFIRDMVAGLPTPTHRPGYAQLLVDSEGAVWLRPFRGASEAGPAVDWQVFSSEGEWLGSVLLPELFRVREIGLDYVLGVRVDRDGVEQVQLLRLSRH